MLFVYLLYNQEKGIWFILRPQDETTPSWFWDYIIVVLSYTTMVPRLQQQTTTWLQQQILSVYNSRPNEAATADPTRLQQQTQWGCNSRPYLSATADHHMAAAADHTCLQQQTTHVCNSRPYLAATADHTRLQQMTRPACNSRAHILHKQTITCCNSSSMSVTTMGNKYPVNVNIYPQDVVKHCWFSDRMPPNTQGPGSIPNQCTIVLIDLCCKIASSHGIGIVMLTQPWASPIFFWFFPEQGESVVVHHIAGATDHPMSSITLRHRSLTSSITCVIDHLVSSITYVSDHLESLIILWHRSSCVIILVWGN